MPSSLINLVIEACKAAPAPSNSTLWVAIASGASAVLGAATVAIANYRTSKKAAEAQLALETKKLHANLVTSERLRWLQDLRARMSNFFAQLDMQIDLLRRPVSAPQQAQRQKELDDLSQKIMIDVNNIILVLNPNKLHQLALRQALNSALQIALNGFAPGNHQVNMPQYTKVKTDAFDAMTEIGIETWAQVQKLE